MADEIPAEELIREQIGNLMLHAITHKEENVKAILGHIAFAEKTQAGLQKFVDAIKDGKTSNEQLGQMIRVLSTTAIKQAEAIRQLGTIMMIYVASQSFSSDASEVAIKNGKGAEALRAFARAKFGKIFDGDQD